jgi:uncharacterized UBP type Zn finger protein
MAPQVPIHNANNSCYIDSVIMALLHPIVTRKTSNYWYSFLFKKSVQSLDVEGVRKELKTILKNIKYALKKDCKEVEYMTCFNLRALLDKFSTFNSNHDNEWTHTQQDPVDVIYILEHIFNIPQRNQFRIKGVGIEKTSLIGLQIPAYMLRDKATFRTFFPSFYDKDTKTTRVFEKGEMIYIQLNRNWLDVEKIKTDFVFPRKISNLNLVSIILHIGSSPTSGHYVTIMRLNRKSWLYYDGMSSELEYIDDSDLYTTDVKRNAVGILYVQ